MARRPTTGVLIFIKVALLWTAGCQSWVIVDPIWLHRHHSPLPRLLSSSTLFCTTTIDAIATAGLASFEVELLRTALQELVQQQQLDDAIEGPLFSVPWNLNVTAMRVLENRACPRSCPGATGRVALLGYKSATSDSDPEKQGEENTWKDNLQLLLSEQWDEWLYDASMPEIKQPVLIALADSNEMAASSRSDENLLAHMTAVVEKYVQEYELRIPLPKRPNNMPSLAAVPALQWEVDGATVTDTSLSNSGPFTFFDTSSVLVFDKLVSEELRQELLRVVLGEHDEENIGYDHDWNDAEQGPDPRRWVRGGLVDTLVSEGMEEVQDDIQCQRSSQEQGGHGLTADGIDDLCYQHHDALQELECILSSLFPSVTLSRLPGAVFGEEVVSPLTANAPVAGDVYQPHIDGDPFLTPPSPWTDVFGRYPNRTPGKPRFMSCLVYLNDEWRYDEWGAPTRVWDVATDTVADIAPKPGRIVLIDQDITHSVVAPTMEAGKRPRYSLVWKLILHPNSPCSAAERQDMKMSIRQPAWPEPTFIGSAAANG